ncbi:uncharacterized protein LOC144208606 [Stigmatopora nigra]
MRVADVRVQIGDVRRQDGLGAGRLHGRALQSCSELTISRRNSDRLRTRRCSTFILHRAPTAGKDQECGQNDQKGAACRRHNKNSTQVKMDHTTPDIPADSEFHKWTWFLHMNR